MKKILFLVFILFSLVNLNAQTYYGGGKHTSSHGGYYSGGVGSSHKGGHYINANTNNQYGVHKTYPSYNISPSQSSYPQQNYNQYHKSYSNYRRRFR